MMAYNRPLLNDPFFAGRVTESDMAQQQQRLSLSRPRGLPSSLPLHQGPGAARPLQQQQQHSLRMTDFATASPESLDSSMLMRHLMIRRAAQQAQELQSLQNALLTEAGNESLQQQLQQEQLQQRYQSMLQHRQAETVAFLEQCHQSPVLAQGAQSKSLLHHRQAGAILEQYQQSPVPVPGLDLLRSISLAQQQRQEQQQQQQQQRMQLGLPALGKLDHGSFLSPSPNQAPSARLTASDLSMLPRAPFTSDTAFNAPASPTSPSNQTLYSPSSGSTTGKNTVKLFVDDIREWDVLCGRGGRSNHHPGNKRYRCVVSDMKTSYRTTEAKARKTDLSRAIVEHVCQYGGRFLKKDLATNGYYVLTKAEARKKTSQALRETKQLKWTL